MTLDSLLLLVGKIGVSLLLLVGGGLHKDAGLCSQEVLQLVMMGHALQCCSRPQQLTNNFVSGFLSHEFEE